MHSERFNDEVIPLQNSLYRFAKSLLQDSFEAEDVVQEAYLRAFKHFAAFKGGDARPWLLAIVRNTFYTWIQRNRVPAEVTPFEEENDTHVSDAPDPEMQLLKETDKQILRSALRKLPSEYLEVIVLREFEELSYKEIANVVHVPLGTVMSRLARARKRLAELISKCRESGT